MADLGEALIPIRATLDKLDGDLAQARGKVDGALGQIGKNVQNLGKIALGGIVAGIAALGAGIVAVASKAIPAASNLNEAMNAVNVVFGDSAGTILEWGKTADTQAGLSQSAFAQMAAQTGAMLQNLGLDTETAADQTINLAQRASDMASIFNTDVNDALVAIQAGLRGEADPLERFGVSLSAANVQAKALEMGLEDTNGEFDQAALTQARLALLYEQTDKIAGDFVNTSDQLANATRVNQARWENFMAQIGGFALPIVQTLQGMLMRVGEVVMPVITSALEKVMPVVQGVVDAFATFVGWILEGMSPLDALPSLVSAVAQAFGMSQEEAAGLFLKVQELGERLTAFIDEVKAVVGPILESVMQFVSWKDVLVAVGIAIASVVIPIIVSLATSMLPLIATAALLIGAVALIRNAWESNWGGIQEKVQAVIDFIVPLVTNAIAQVKEWWAQNGDELLARAQETWQTIQAAIQTAITFIQGIIQAVTAVIQSAWEQHGASITASAQRFWEAIKGFIERTITNIQTIITNIATAIQAFWERHGEAIRAGAEAAWDKIKELIDTAMQAISTLFNTFAALFEGDWQGFIDGLKELWQAGLDAIVMAFGALWDLIKPILTGLWTDISGWFSGKVSAFFEIGQNLITSLADAISQRANAYLKKVAQGVADLLPQWVKEILGIASPSSVFAEIGSQVGLGMAEGILGSAGAVHAAMGALLGIPSFNLDKMLPAYAAHSGMAAGAEGGSVSNWSLTINEAGQRGNVVADFALLKALAR